MQHFTSELFGVVPQPDSFGEIVELALDPTPDELRAVRMWRGHGDIAWPIHSSAYRRLALRGGYLSGGDFPNERDIQSYEKDLLKRADHKGFRWQNGRRLSDFELLACLRHHEAATRLMDATKSVLVALWFCVADQPEKVGLLLGIHAHYVGGYEGESEERPYEEILEGACKYDHPMTWEPSPNSPRIAAQHSQFLYSSVSDDPIGSLRLPKDSGAILAVAVTPQLKATSKKILIELFDIRTLTLFPDFDGFSFSNSAMFDTGSSYRW